MQALYGSLCKQKNMSSHRQFNVRAGRFKKNYAENTASLFQYFPREDETVDSQKTVRKIVDDLVISATDQAEKKGKTHTGWSVSEKTIRSWLNQYPWMTVTGEELNKRLKCSICTDRKVRSIWANEGSANVQKNSIERHGDSEEHKQAERELLKCKNKVETCNVDVNKEDESVCVEDDDVKLFRTIFYVSKEELPTEKVNSLIELQNLNGAKIKYKNLSYVTINEIQDCISSIIQRSLVEEIVQSDFYAVMIDESTDLSVQKHLSVCVRYVKNGEAVTKFLANVAIEDGKAHTIVQQLIKCLTHLGLDPTKIVSLATDGAATMTGKKTGVGVQMKSKYAPFSVQSHCIAHRLNLAITDSIKKLDTLKKFRDKFNSLYYFMSGSANRTTRLKNIQQLFGEPELTIKEPHSVRWLGLKNAVEAVYESYSSVLATLSNFATEKMATAEGLLKYFSEYKTVLLVSFMLDIHDVLAVLSQQLQKKNLVFSEIQPLMEGTLSKLEFLESQYGHAEKAMRECIEIRQEEAGTSAYLNGEKLKKYSEKIESELSDLKKVYISSLKKNIRHRFRKEDSEIFNDFSLLLEPAVVSGASTEETEAALEAIGTFYSVKEVTIVHGDIEEPREEKTEVAQLLDKEKLKQEWPILKGMISGSYKQLNTQTLCSRVIQLHNNMMPELAKLCTIALCISVTSVECERSFSAQNRIKSKYRCSLKTENLNSLLNIQMNSITLSDYNPVTAVKLWITKKKRRIGRLCQPYKPRVKRPREACSSHKTC